MVTAGAMDFSKMNQEMMFFTGISKIMIPVVFSMIYSHVEHSDGGTGIILTAGTFFPLPMV